MADGAASGASQLLWQSPRCRRACRDILQTSFFRAVRACTLPRETFQAAVAQGGAVGAAFQSACEGTARQADRGGFANVTTAVNGAREVFRLLDPRGVPGLDSDMDVNFENPLPATAAYVAHLDAVAADLGRSMDTGSLVRENISRACATLLSRLYLYAWMGTVLQKAVPVANKETWQGCYQTFLHDGASEARKSLTDDLAGVLDSCVAEVLDSLSSAEQRCDFRNTIEDAFAKGLEHELALVTELPGLLVDDSSDSKGCSGEPPRLRDDLLLHGALVPPRVLIVAGSDSGGGAGIQADIKTCTVLGVFSTTAVTALTAQNSHGVQSVMPVPVDFVAAQIRSVVEDFDTDVVKTGMLLNAEIVRAVVAELRKGTETQRWRRKLVVDPVMVSTSGHRLLEDDAIACIRTELLPMATIVTPNIPEAQVLLGVEIKTKEDMKQAAVKLCQLGPLFALIKGGHLPRSATAEATEDAIGATDVFYSAAEEHFEEYHKPWIDTTHTHGTGCALASAIAAHLANGSAMVEAVKSSKQFISDMLHRSANLNLGTGPQAPMNHTYGNYAW